MAEPFPHPPLPTPVRLLGDGAEGVFGHDVPSFLRPGQKQQRLLNVGGQVIEGHDLGKAGTGDVAKAGKLG